MDQEGRELLQLQKHYLQKYGSGGLWDPAVQQANQELSQTNNVAGALERGLLMYNALTTEDPEIQHMLEAATSH